MPVALKLNIPVVLHEQNSVPGKANKFLSKYANVVCVSIKDTLKYFKNGVFTGNPRSEVVLKSKTGDKSKYKADALWVSNILICFPELVALDLHLTESADLSASAFAR